MFRYVQTDFQKKLIYLKVLGKRLHFQINKGCFKPFMYDQIYFL